MDKTQPMTVTLPPEMAELVTEKIASGEYSSVLDVICEALLSMAGDDVMVNRWMADREDDTSGLEEDFTLLESHAGVHISRGASLESAARWGFLTKANG
ncbi:MAG: hypothetical protein LBR29_10050 [Methylobacteriaceae bacterium]|nr:hypothetical protein [Methylobacteriaceae bacterium]